MELLQHTCHPHPLKFGDDYHDCSGCEETYYGRFYSCVNCDFHLHEKCAKAPMEIDDHPFHRRHPLILRLIPSDLPGEEDASCNFCHKRGMGFMYHCSPCEFYLHMKCALLPRRDKDGQFIMTLNIFAHQHPLIVFEHDFTYFSYIRRRRFRCSQCTFPVGKLPNLCACFDCNIFFHKKCLERLSKINHPHHRKHQLILDSTSDCLVCNLCETQHSGFFYRCSHCCVYINEECAFPSPIIEDISHHEHPFTLLLRPNSFTCDACGTKGNNVSYLCSTCNIQVHKKCISLPCIIAINLHHHPLDRNFFLCLPQHDHKTWECQICFQKVNMEHSSYYCSEPDCNFVVHVNCAMQNKDIYGVIELENQDEVKEHTKRLALLNEKSKDCITKEIKEGEDAIAAAIKHISHDHKLTFSSNGIKDKSRKHCNGCMLPILSSFYYCSECDFFLHKACAELSKQRLLWFSPLIFTLCTNHGFFKCFHCQYECSGFSYKSNDTDVDSGICLRCAALSHSFTYQAHHLFFDTNYKGHCSACGSDERVPYRSLDCKFAFDRRCLTLPQTVWHKCDKHSLTLTCQDDSDYPLQHYCDICEERRDPKHWFYRCSEGCDTTVHPECVFRKYSFIKLGNRYLCENHPYYLTSVRKDYDSPQCNECGEPCEDLSLECSGDGCNYIIHWKCKLLIAWMVNDVLNWV